MNVYEETHKLATAIRESEEYKSYMAAKKRLEENTELNSAIKDFEAKSAELQTKQLLGEENLEDMMKSVTELSGILMQDPLAAEYLQTQIRFSVMIKDVFDILGEVVKIGI